jgi:hypothetical protein
MNCAEGSVEEGGSLKPSVTSMLHARGIDALGKKQAPGGGLAASSQELGIFDFLELARSPASYRS